MKEDMQDVSGTEARENINEAFNQTEDAPTSEDPFGSNAESDRIAKMQQNSDGPTYERNQGTADQSTGGSTDPNNSLTHANSGDETERGGNEAEQVDGYSDTNAEATVGSPDPGIKSNLEPLTPDEYAKAQKEARAEDHGK